MLYFCKHLRIGVVFFCVEDYNALQLYEKEELIREMDFLPA